MYCPNCGQQQNVTELKFCSRCGFPMAGVIHLLSAGGLLPEPIPEQTTLKGLSPRQKGQRQGAMMMLLTLLLVPLMAIITVNLEILPELIIPLTAIVLFVGGLLRIGMYHLIWLRVRSLRRNWRGPPNKVSPLQHGSAHETPRNSRRLRV